MLRTPASRPMSEYADLSTCWTSNFEFALPIFLINCEESGAVSTSYPNGAACFHNGVPPHTWFKRIVEVEVFSLFIVSSWSTHKSTSFIDNVIEGPEMLRSMRPQDFG
jgi:hypothetical protein